MKTWLSSLFRNKVSKSKSPASTQSSNDQETSAATTVELGPVKIQNTSEQPQGLTAKMPDNPCGKLYYYFEKSVEDLSNSSLPLRERIGALSIAVENLLTHMREEKRDMHRKVIVPGLLAFLRSGPGQWKEWIDEPRLSVPDHDTMSALNRDEHSRLLLDILILRISLAKARVEADISDDDISEGCALDVGRGVLSPQLQARAIVMPDWHKKFIERCYLQLMPAIIKRGHHRYFDFLLNQYTTQQNGNSTRLFFDDAGLVRLGGLCLKAAVSVVQYTQGGKLAGLEVTKRINKRNIDALMSSQFFKEHFEAIWPAGNDLVNLYGELCEQGSANHPKVRVVSFSFDCLINHMSQAQVLNFKCMTPNRLGPGEYSYQPLYLLFLKVSAKLPLQERWIARSRRIIWPSLLLLCGVGMAVLFVLQAAKAISLVYPVSLVATILLVVGSCLALAAISWGMHNLGSFAHIIEPTAQVIDNPRQGKKPHRALAWPGLLLLLGIGAVVPFILQISKMISLSNYDILVVTILLVVGACLALAATSWGSWNLGAYAAQSVTYQEMKPFE